MGVVLGRERGGITWMMSSRWRKLVGYSFREEMGGIYGYGGFPNGFEGLGWVPLTLKPVWVYESPLSLG